MKVYAQFKVMSTGYVPNSIPPQFSDEFKKPIDLLGSDGVAILDARKGKWSLIEDAIKIISKHANTKAIVGFDIIKASSFLDKGKVLYSYTINGKS